MSLRVCNIVSVILLLAMPCTVFAANAVELIINTTNKAPYSSVDGGGFLDYITQEIGRQSGSKLSIVTQPPERGLRNANSGQIDGDLTRINGISTIYPNLVQVKEKIIEWEFAAFSKDPKILKSWKTAATIRIAFIKGWKIYEKKTQNKPYVRVARSPQQLFNLLKLDRADVVLYERWQGLALLRSMGISERVYHELIEKKDMFLYLHEKHKEKAVTFARILAQLKKDGVYFKKYRELLTPYLATE